MPESERKFHRHSEPVATARLKAERDFGVIDHPPPQQPTRLIRVLSLPVFTGGCRLAFGENVLQKVVGVPVPRQ